MRGGHQRYTEPSIQHKAELARRLMAAPLRRRPRPLGFAIEATRSVSLEWNEVGSCVGTRCPQSGSALASDFARVAPSVVHVVIDRSSRPRSILRRHSVSLRRLFGGNSVDFWHAPNPAPLSLQTSRASRPPSSTSSSTMAKPRGLGRRRSGAAISCKGMRLPGPPKLDSRTMTSCIWVDGRTRPFKANSRRSSLMTNFAGKEWCPGRGSSEKSGPSG
jgi:hypothetical protein